MLLTQSWVPQFTPCECAGKVGLYASGHYREADFVRRWVFNVLINRIGPLIFGGINLFYTSLILVGVEGRSPFGDTLAGGFVTSFEASAVPLPSSALLLLAGLLSSLAFPNRLSVRRAK